MKNLPRVKSRLKKYLAHNQQRYDLILCQILYLHNTDIPRIAAMVHLTTAEVRKCLREALLPRDYAAMNYATNPSDKEEWRELGEKFVRSLPQTTDEDVRLYTPFIVECMQWGQ